MLSKIYHVVEQYENIMLINLRIFSATVLKWRRR